MTMEQKSSPVNTRRRYDSSGRRERARQTRDQIVDAARELFLADGYAATTVAAIAAAARVSVETIYKGFGGKPGLVRAIAERGLAGQGPVPAEQRSDHIRDTEPDPRRILAAWGTFTAEIAPRVAPILMLARDAAASDPEVALTLEQISAARLDRMALNARGLFEAGHLRPEITPGEAADIMWTYSSPELYELLVLRRGWSGDRYGRFVGQALIAALLPSEDT
jgi:AcrR family transcriptional regulator